MLPEVNYRPEGAPAAYSGPEDMSINQEIWKVLSGHYAVPQWPDGACVCGEDVLDGQITHLIEVLQSYQGGNMPTFSEDEDVYTTSEEAQADERVSAILTVSSPFDLTDYDVRREALDAALRLQENVDEYANVEALLAEADEIYDWLSKGTQ